jgi:hypothetical protein
MDNDETATPTSKNDTAGKLIPYIVIIKNCHNHSPTAALQTSSSPYIWWQSMPCIFDTALQRFELVIQNEVIVHT